MGQVKKQQFTAAFKAKVALEAIKGIETTSQLAARFQVHPIQIGKWKKQLLANSTQVFSDDERKKLEREKEMLDDLYRQIGKKDIEISWLKKKVGMLE